MSQSTRALSLFDDGKAPGAMRTIGEVSHALNIKPHVLRYWEQQFPALSPLKRSGGRRLYRQQDIALIETINRLVNREGYTLRGARKALSEKPRTADGAQNEPVDAPALVVDTTQTVKSLREVRKRLALALEE